VLPGIDLNGGNEVAERLRAAVEQTRPLGIPVTMSLGLSAGRGEQVDYAVLFKAADDALYEAKRAGRNKVLAAAGTGDGDNADADGTVEGAGVDASPALAFPIAG
jgi:diguanylate cyclase (GGDEF)-like protein